MRFPILRHRSFDYYLLGNGGFLMSGPKIWSSSSSEDGSRSRGRYSPHEEWDCFFFFGYRLYHVPGVGRDQLVYAVALFEIYHWPPVHPELTNKELQDMIFLSFLTVLQERNVYRVQYIYRYGEVREFFEHRDKKRAYFDNRSSICSRNVPGIWTGRDQRSHFWRRYFCGEFRRRVFRKKSIKLQRMRK